MGCHFIERDTEMNPPSPNSQSVIQEPEYLYRYVDTNHAAIDDYDRVASRYATVDCKRYRIVRRTKKGVRISLGWREEKFVLLSGHKRFAYPTQGDAMVSFMRRKERQLLLLRAQIAHVERAIAVAADVIPHPGLAQPSESL